MRGLAALRSQLSEHTGQLKALVKENFDRFISRCAWLGWPCTWLLLPASQCLTGLSMSRGNSKSQHAVWHGLRAKEDARG